MAATLQFVSQAASSTEDKRSVIVKVIEIDHSDARDSSPQSSTNSFLETSHLSELLSSAVESLRLTSKPFYSTTAITRADPHVNALQRTHERIRLAYTFAASSLHDFRYLKDPISPAQRFCRRVVNPLFTWNSENSRTIVSKSLAITTIEDTRTGTKDVIHAASHNYAGFYRPTEESESLHKLALDRLPVLTEDEGTIQAALHKELADFFSADFCFTTSTGYGSNLLAFPGILSTGWLCIMDAKSHNSMHVGAYLSNANKVVKYRHNDVSHLQEILEKCHLDYDHILVAVEGLYSMDGTLLPLWDLSKLKNQYNFSLLVDEAHSLLSIGSKGGGCLEMWNETYPEHPVEPDLIDVRTAVLSKSLGAIGGLVCGKLSFKAGIEHRQQMLRESGVDPVLTATMVQCLHVLAQPTILRRRLARLRQISQWSRRELQRFGIHIYGEAVTPVLPIHTGRPSVAAKLSYSLRQHGVLATPVSIPAVPFWQARIRVCLSADHNDEQITRIVRTIVIAAQEVGLIPGSVLNIRSFESMATEQRLEVEALEVFQSVEEIETLIEEDTKLVASDQDQCMIQAGHAARHQFGFASGGARWIAGTFSIHNEVEELLRRALEIQAALTYGDSYLGLLSTVSALCRPLLKQKSHVFMLPRDGPQAIWDGMRAAPRKATPTIQTYETVDELQSLIMQARSRHEQITIYLSTRSLQLSDMGSLVSQATTGHKVFRQNLNPTFGLPGLTSSNLTILLDDTEGFLRDCQGRLHLRTLLAACHNLTPYVLIFGKFKTSFGVPGAWLGGSEALIEELRYTSRGYMFTTSPLPFVMGMVKKGLERAGSVNVES